MSTSIFGSVVRRVEDPRFLTGAGRYTEAMRPGDALRAVFVRSIIAHGRVSGVLAEAAAAMPGVVAVLGADDLNLRPQPPSGNVTGPFERPILASGVVRYVGEPIALVLAETLGQALDAAESVLVDVEPLEPVVGAEAALAGGAPLLFPEAGTNLAHEYVERWDEDVLAGADVVVRARVVHQRLAPVPMETNAVVARPDGEDAITLWVSTQVPFDVRNDVAEWLGLERSNVRVIAPDVGGGFGTKLRVYPEYLACAAAARRTGRAVAWQEGRTESMVGLAHGRAQVHYVELGAKRDGTLVGLRVDIIADMGAYPGAAYLPVTTKTMLPGAYRIPRVAARGRAVVTNTVPVGEYRGAGRPEAAATIERAIDLLALELAEDPIELRRRAAIPRDAFPFTSAVGSRYDTGDYVGALDEAARLADVDGLRRRQAGRRASGDRLALGIGVALYVEVTGFGRKEFASVEVGSGGAATVRVGTSSHGQGHETAFAQVAAGVLGIPMERIHVVHSDTGEVERGEGTYGSRSLQVGGTSVFRAAEVVLERAREAAAEALEVAPEDVALTEDGRFGVAGAPDAAMTWAEVAERVVGPGSGGPGLVASARPFQQHYTYPFGAHVAVVEVDTETGDVRLVRHVAVDDCGRILNPMLVEGQVHGGLGQGIAQALFEEVVYDEAGTPLTPNLATYAMPAASELPSFERGVLETPTPLNPLGAKGIGESATVGSTPAVVNAAVDALSHLGVRHLDPPLTPERVWRAIRATRAGGQPPDRAARLDRMADVDAAPLWEQRFRAATQTFPHWGRLAPDRLVYTSDQDGSFQVYAWDRTSGEPRRLSNEPVGVGDDAGTVSADGARVIWFSDPTGDESGRWVATPFEGGEGQDVLPGAPVGWPEGLAVGAELAVGVIADREGFALYVSERGGPAREIHRDADAVSFSSNDYHVEGADRVGLSADETLVCVEVAQAGDNIHRALLVLDPRTGETVAELADGPGFSLSAFGWSPVAGDPRLLVGHERDDLLRPSIWDPVAGERVDLAVDLPGGVVPLDWWPDASAILLNHRFRGRDRLYRYDLGTGALTEVVHPAGEILGAGVRPDGRVWLRVASGDRASRVLDDRGEDVLPGPATGLREGRPYREWLFRNPAGDTIHGWLVTPEGDGPFPTFLKVHGGPDWLYLDTWWPDVQMLVDEGFAVAMVNYRGSIGYGRSFRDHIIGNIGFPEVEDTVAGLDDLIARGIADPARAVIGGWSWGGYITLLALGTHPDRFVAGVAGVPIGDYMGSYDDSAPGLQAYDRSLIGGVVHDIPDFVAERSPITYVDRVRAPALVLVAENDSRCVPAQVYSYVDALKGAGGDVEVYSYDEGHSSFVLDEELREWRTVLDFLRRHVPGV